MSKAANNAKKTAWEAAAKEIGGVYTPGRYFSFDKIFSQYKHWNIMLDELISGDASKGNQKHFTRIRAPFINQQEVFVRIFKENFFTKIIKKIKIPLQDIVISDKDFDEAFIIQGNDEEKIQQLLEAPTIKQLFHELSKIELKVTKNAGFFGPSFPKNVNLLYFLYDGKIQESALLLRLFYVVASFLDRMVEVGIASADDPKVQLK